MKNKIVRRGLCSCGAEIEDAYTNLCRKCLLKRVKSCKRTYSKKLISSSDMMYVDIDENGLRAWTTLEIPKFMRG